MPFAPAPLFLSFAGIYKKGAGLGPAITFLFFAPAANILALIYTGGVIGVDLAIARLVLSLAFGIGIGIIMALIFRHEDVEHDKATDAMFAAQGKMRRVALIFLLVLVSLLLSGTLKVGLLTNTYSTFTVPVSGMDKFQDFLYNLIPFDSTKGEEGVTAQGAILIGLLVLIGVTSWKGMENIFDGFNIWTWTSLSLVGTHAFDCRCWHVPTFRRIGYPHKRKILWRIDRPRHSRLDSQNKTHRR